MNIDKDKIYLITGGTGFLGKTLVKRLYSKCKLRVMARNEGNLISLKEEFPKIQIYPGDITDLFDVRQSVSGVSGVFHLAAFKHVGLAETHVRECTKSNIIGTIHLLDETTHCDFILGISTDKAAQVSGIYGASKSIVEKLFKQYEQLNNNCKYRLVRYGNVLYSTGSVLCKWKKLIKNGKEIIITDPNATRFFWNVDQAIDLIIECMEAASDSSPYCPSMKAMSMENLAMAMIKKYGDGRDIPFKIIGLQPGENLHEKVLDNGPYSNEVEQFTIDEILELI
jgi:UDP-N-acetylglucosamine 4,6-dehydratase/UDP-glucose 4-epimerase